ncbi:isochorismatase family protein [Bacillus sp. Marseille-P3661]|uniref:isochorismatase family protein n=1 Tax=Bacillus sp. Marseille-P3661 TaxID=1936234 RepID=UPI000C81E33B|nr:isochorismatase family protein [Bacillus sp. Marseille-P3661]
MDKHYLSINEASKMLGLSPSTLRRLEKENKIEGYGLNVYYTPGGQRRYSYNELEHAYQRWGACGKMGFGKKPCIIVRELTRFFTDPSSKAAYPLDNVILQTQSLLKYAKTFDIPVFFIARYYDPNNLTSRLWASKIESSVMVVKGSVWTEIDPRIRDFPFKEIIYTPYLSPFFNSNLDSMLKELDIDTTIIIGNSASGSILISAVDALQNGYHTIIPKEAVADRTEASRQTALTDLGAKYADVVSVESVIKYFKDLKQKKIVEN